MNEHEVVGRNVRRVDGVDKVCGRARFAADLSLPGMLHGKVLLSDRPAARVVRVGVARARALKGVAAVLTGNDVMGLGRYGVIVQDQPVLVKEGEQIRFVGDALAIVAAESEEIAEQAVQAIEVELEDLPALCTVEVALADDARQLHEGRSSNICAESEFVLGDIDQAFADADLIIEQEFQTARAEHAYLETEAGIAYLDAHGCLTVESCLQDPFHFQNDIARALGIPMNKLRVVSPPVGGGFGAKLDVTIQHWLALLALETRRPVKMVLTREESIKLHPKRHPMTLRVKLGVLKEQQKVIALDASVLIDAGAYTGRSPTVLGINQMALSGPYAIPNVRLKGIAVFTNNPPSGAFRGYGAPQAVMATEATINLLVRELGVDPIEFRLRNTVRQEDKPINPHIVFDSPISMGRVAERMLAAAGPPLECTIAGKLVGRGIAFDMPTFDVGVFPAIGLTGIGAAIQMFQDGSITIYSSASEVGQGVGTVLAQIAAEVLGLPVESISLVLTDTAPGQKAGPTSASRQTYGSGNAVFQAAAKLRTRLLERAKQELRCGFDQLDMRAGSIYDKRNPAQCIELSRIATLCFVEGINLLETAWFKTEHGARTGHTFMACLSDVTVDDTTGEIKVEKLVVAHDVGRAINPAGVTGQLIGGAAQGIGLSLLEELKCANGLVDSCSLLEYRIPTAVDVPEEVDVVIVEEPYPSGPFGAKGVGESAVRCVPPAILNAVANAIGWKITRIPITPSDVLDALGEKRKVELGSV